MNSPPAPSNEVMTLDCERVMLVLPHRYPFLLVDRVIALIHPWRQKRLDNGALFSRPFA